MKSRILAALMIVLCAPLASRAENQPNANNLFNKQLSSQKQVLNTGIQYWIELKRGKQSSKVNNKFAFKSGDSIRLHLRSNTDAYAYIVLAEGSRGEQSVLFPDERHTDNNRIKAGADYILPADGFLTFDENPGTEKLLILISRKPVQAKNYLADKSKKHVVISSEATGAKDLIPGSVVLAYPEQSESPQSLDSDLVLPNKTEVQADGGSSRENSSTTTFVQTDPSQVLLIDLALAHKAN